MSFESCVGPGKLKLTTCTSSFTILAREGPKAVDSGPNLLIAVEPLSIRGWEAVASTTLTHGCLSSLLDELGSQASAPDQAAS